MTPIFTGSIPRPSIPSIPDLDFDFMGFEDITMEELNVEDIELGEDIVAEKYKRKLLQIPDILDGTKTRAEVFANPESEFKVEEVTPEKTDLEIFKGKLKQRVRNLSDGDSYAVQAPQAVLGVRGTEFLVSAGEDRTLMAVFDGEVDVSSRDGDETLTVQSNEMVVIEEGKEFPSSPETFTDEDTVRTSIELVGGKHYVDGEPHETEPYRFIAGVWNLDGGLEDVQELRIATPHHEEELTLERRKDDEGVLYGFEKEVTYPEPPELAGEYTLMFQVDKNGDTEIHSVDLEYTYQEFPEDYVNTTRPEHHAEDVSLTPQIQWESVPEKYEFITLEVGEADSGEAAVNAVKDTEATTFELADGDALDQDVSYQLLMPLIEKETVIDETQLPFRFTYNMVNATVNETDFTTAAAPPLEVHSIELIKLKLQMDGESIPPEYIPPYLMLIVAEGSDIASAVVEGPDDIERTLEWDDSEESWEWGDDYDSETELDDGWPAGEYTFIFNGGAESVAVNYAPQAVPESFLEITYPAHEETDVNLNPIYTWESAAGAGDALRLSVFEDPDDLDEKIYHEFPADISTTSWQPGPLAGNTEYSFETAVVNMDPAGGPVASETGQTVEYSGMAMNYNFVEFATTDDSEPGLQQLPLDPGFQFISSNLMPADPGMRESIFAGLINNDSLNFVRDSAGGTLQYILGQWSDGIGEWNSTEGYLVRMDAADTLEISGEPIDPQTRINLQAGFQFIAYLPDHELTAQEAFDALKESGLVFVRDSAGSTLQHILGRWSDGIGDMSPGEGFLIRMSEPAEFVYPEE